MKRIEIKKLSIKVKTENEEGWIKLSELVETILYTLYEKNMGIKK